MHRPLFVLAALLLAPSVFAQSYAIDKGSYLLGGTVSFSSQGGELFFSGDEDGDRATIISVNPTFGYFITPGVALGGDVQFTKSSQSDFSSTTIGIGPSIAYYFGQPTTRTFPFIGATIGYLRSAYDLGEDFEPTSISVNGYQFGVSGGLSHMIARNVALTGALFYQSQTFRGASGDTFGFRGGVTAFVF